MDLTHAWALKSGELGSSWGSSLASLMKGLMEVSVDSRES